MTLTLPIDPRLVLLIMGHAFADFFLQGDTIAIGKNPFNSDKEYKGAPWYYWMASHALIHGFFVSIITGNVALGILETIAHFGIDTAKCKGWLNIHQDQICHVSCKVVWTMLA